MDPASAPNIFLNSYQGTPRGRDYELWREETCRRFCSLDILPSDSDIIDCNIQISLLGGLALAVPTGTSALFARTPAVLGDGCDDLVLVTATAGRVQVVQEGTPIELATKQMCLADMSVLGTVGQTGTAQFKTIRIPRAALLSLHPQAEDRLDRVIGEEPALRETIMRYHALAAELAPQLDVVGQQLMAQHMIDLIGLLLGAQGDRAELARGRGQAAARLDLMRADVMANLAQADLSLAALAPKYGLSTRQAQRLFEQTETSFTEFLREQRLLLARRLLLDPRNRRRKISDIAHSAGFSDVSYFNREFRRRFGMRPTDLRHD